MVITVRDIANITGKNVPACQRIMRNIRKSYGKPKNGLVSIVELCNYTSLNIDEVSKFLKY